MNSSHPKSKKKEKKLYPIMRQSKEDNKRTKLVREIPYIDSKELVATDGSANGRDPSPPQEAGRVARPGINRPSVTD